MTLSFRHVCLFVMTACVSQALVVGTLAQDQATPEVAQQNQKAQPTPQTPVSSNAHLKEDWNGQIDAFGFLERVADLCREYQQHVEQGMPPEKESFWLIYISPLPLREDEAQELCTISIDVEDRTKELVHQFYAAHGGKSNFLFHTPPSAERSAEGDKLEQQKRMVTAEAIGKLKQQLTKVSFKSLDIKMHDDFCDFNWEDNRCHDPGKAKPKHPDAPSPATVPGSRKGEENSAPAQIPEARP